MRRTGCSNCDECAACGSRHQDDLETLRVRVAELEAECKAARAWLAALDEFRASGAVQGTVRGNTLLKRTLECVTAYRTLVEGK